MVTLRPPEKAKAERDAARGASKAALRKKWDQLPPKAKTPPSPAAGKSSPVAIIVAAPQQIQQVPIAKIKPDPTQPRKHFDEVKMGEMVKSIKKVGIEQAILVRLMSRWRKIVGFVAQQWARREAKSDTFDLPIDKFWAAGIEISLSELDDSSPIWARLLAEGRVERKEDGKGAWLPIAGATAPLIGETTLPGEPEWLEIVYGERRWRGAGLAELTDIPAKVRELTDVEAAELQAIENLDRDDLNPMEEAHQYAKLLSQPGYTMARLMEVTGRAKNTIHGKLQLLKVPDEVRKAVIAGDLPAVTAERIGRLEGEVQTRAVKAILHPTNHFNTDGKVLTDRQAKEAIERAEEAVKKDQEIEKLKVDAIARGVRWIDEDGAEHKRIFNYSRYPEAKTGYVVLTQTINGDPKLRTYETVLALKSVRKAAKDLKPAIATTRYRQELCELYNAEELRAVIRAAGIVISNKRAAADPIRAKQLARNRVMTSVLERSAEAIRLRSQLFCPRMAQTPEAEAMWRALARSTMAMLGYTGKAEFIKRRGIEMLTFLDARKKPSPDPDKTMDEFLAKARFNDLASIVAESILTRNAWFSGNSEFSQAFVDGAADFGIDLKQLERESGGGHESSADDVSASARTNEEEEEE